MSREAMQMALDVLNAASRIMDANAQKRQDDAIAALRAALAEQPAAAPELGKEWTPCVKLPIVVHVRKQRDGETHVSTREGITPVKPDDLIMRGVAGEEYPIGRELFERTYRIGDKVAEQPAPVVLTDEEIKKVPDGVSPFDPAFVAGFKMGHSSGRKRGLAAAIPPGHVVVPVAEIQALRRATTKPRPIGGFTGMSA